MKPQETIRELADLSRQMGFLTVEDPDGDQVLIRFPLRGNLIVFRDGEEELGVSYQDKTQKIDRTQLLSILEDEEPR